MAGPDGRPLVVECPKCLLVLELKDAPEGSLYRTFVEVRVV